MFNNAKAKPDPPRGAAELWRYGTRAGCWYGPLRQAALSMREAKALLTDSTLLVRWFPPYESPPVLLTRSERTLDRFTRKWCAFTNCDRPAKTRGVCELHFSRLVRAERKERAGAAHVEGDWA